MSVKWTHCRSTADTFQFDLAHRFTTSETFLGIEDFQTRQSAFKHLAEGIAADSFRGT